MTREEAVLFTRELAPVLGQFIARWTEDHDPPERLVVVCDAAVVSLGSYSERAAEDGVSRVRVTSVDRPQIGRDELLDLLGLDPEP